jgi:phage terminase large subunit-like protein
MKPHARAFRFVEAVASGEQPAPKWVRRAVERFLRDVESERWTLATDQADWYIQKIETFEHYKGPKAGMRIHLEDWQCFVLLNLFGWLDPETGVRRFREAFVFVPRGNGKTTLLAAVGLVMGFLEGEGAAEVYSAAVNRDQARICFDAARQMALRASPRTRTGALSKRGFAYRAKVDIQKHQLVSESGGVFKPLSRDAKGLDGLNPHLGVLDELASHQTSEVYDAIKTGSAKRKQSLVFSITTATMNTAGIGFATFEYACKVLDEMLDDDAFFALVYTADLGSDGEPADDIWSEATWRKVNPNWGVSVDPEAFRAAAKKAAQQPTAEAGFKTRHLNVWEGAEQSMFSMKAWRECARPVELADFEGQPCFIGVDLASTTDLVGKVYLFDVDDVWFCFAQAYLPSATIQGGVARYAEFVARGEIQSIPGAAIDLEHIQAELLEDARRFEVQAFAFDPWQAAQMMANIERETGLPCFEVRPTAAHMSEACKELQRRHVTGKLAHDGSAVFAWCVANTVGLEDPGQNIKPSKMRNELKIDLAVAMVQAAVCKLRVPERGVPEVMIL